MYQSTNLWTFFSFGLVPVTHNEHSNRVVYRPTATVRNATRSSAGRQQFPSTVYFKLGVVSVVVVVN